MVQDLNYTYDPTGNITRIKDAALKTTFNANQQVDPASDYTYDPLYRLIKATGREHVGQSAFAFAAQWELPGLSFRRRRATERLRALRNYTEQYVYDPVGNFLTMAHLAGNGAGNWTRNYSYKEQAN